MYRVEVGEPKADDWDPSSDGNDTFAAGAGSDVVYGHGGNDRAIFDDLAGNDHFNGGSGVDTLVMDWHAATTAIVYDALGVNNSSEIGMTESYERGVRRHRRFRAVSLFQGGRALRAHRRHRR